MKQHRSKALADDVMPAANISWLDAFHTMTVAEPMGS